MQRTSFDQKIDSKSGAGDELLKIKKPSYNWTGAASLGYFKDVDGLYYGAKFSLGKAFGQREKKLDATQYEKINAKVSQQYSLALTGQFGSYLTADTVVYGLFGVKRVRYNIDVTAIDAGGNHPVKASIGKTVWGPVFGAGMKKALSDAWSFNTEVSYEMYKNISTGNTDQLNAGQELGVKIKPRVWNVTVGLSHKF